MINSIINSATLYTELYILSIELLILVVPMIINNKNNVQLGTKYPNLSNVCYISCQRIEINLNTLQIVLREHTITREYPQCTNYLDRTCGTVFESSGCFKKKKNKK